jgi:hypothetical protein
MILISAFNVPHQVAIRRKIHAFSSRKSDAKPIKNTDAGAPRSSQGALGEYFFPDSLTVWENICFNPQPA